MPAMNWDERGLLAAAVAVVIGVLLEGAEHLHDIRTKGWRPIAPKIGFAILVIGLAVETVFEARIGKSAAETSLKAAKLEDAVAWRHLNPQQRANIVATLRGYGGEKINVFSYFGDLEAEVFADQIAQALGGKDGAGWIMHFATITWSPRTFSGSLVETVPSATDHDRDAAKSLVLALSTGITPVVGPMVKDKTTTGETLRGAVDKEAPLDLVVGTHPEAILK